MWQKIILICLIFLVAATAPAIGQRLLNPYNLNFEIGEDGKLPPGWIVPTYASKNGYSASLTSLNPKNGKYCFEIKKEEGYKEEIYGSVMQSLDAKPYCGKTVKFRAAVRAEISGPKGSAHLWIRARVPNDQVGFFEMMENNPVVINEWQYYEITGKIDEDAVDLNFGLLLFGTGKAWIDDASFEILDSSESVYEPPNPLTGRELENLAAFSKLFGYVRYYYAGSESQNNDWERFALTGTEIAQKAGNPILLAEILNDLFLPIAPGLKIHTEAQKSTKKTKSTSVPPEALKDIALAWKHVGPKTGMDSKLFSSKVVNVYLSQREREGTALQIMNVENLRNSEIEFSAYVKANVIKPAGNAQLWLRIDDANDKAIYTVAMFDKPITDNSWKQYSIKAKVPAEAKLIRLGLVLTGEGEAWFDDTKLKVISEDSAKEIMLKNPGFEEGISGELLRGWRFSPLSESVGYSGKIIHNNVYKGKSCLLISSDERTRITFPKVNEVLSAKLSDGVYFDMPLTVFADSTHTLPLSDELKEKYKSSKPDNFEYSGKDRTSRLAVVTILWNILRQFNLYNNNEEIWNEALRKSLAKVATDKNETDFIETLENLIEKLNDSQARVWLGETHSQLAVPFLWKWINDQLFITEITTGIKDLKPGDQVMEIDGKPAEEYVSAVESRISSATPQWKKLRALAMARAGLPNTKVKLKIQSSDGKIFEKEFERTIYLSELADVRPPEFARINNDITYIDLTRLKDNELKSIVDSLTNADKIIFDLRGLCLASEHFLGFFTNSPMKSLEWEIPIFTYPDQKYVSRQLITNSIKYRGKLTGKKIVFLCDERSVGFSETFLSIAKNNGLGEIVGSPTAGTAGEIAAFRLPGGYGVTMTSIRVNLPDGKELYGEGVQPTVPAYPTKETIKAGRDAAFDKAVEVLSK